MYKVLDNLKGIKSATYFRYQYATAPNDTVFSKNYNNYTKEYSNPIDTFVGASVANFSQDDTLRMVYFYDGKAKSYLNWDAKTVTIDSFQNNKYSFRVVYPPFFSRVKHLINYSLQTKDNVNSVIKDFGDSVLISLSIYDKYVEVIGNRVINENPRETEKRFSKYKIWINKSNGLPYCIESAFPDKKAYEKIRIISINNSVNEVLDARKNIPSDFKFIFPNNTKQGPDLVGKIAAKWILKDINSKEISLDDLKSKIILIQFTGIGCGPCHLSVPYLKGLLTEFNKEDLELISIETFNTNIPVIKRYITSNNIKNKYLLSSGNIKTNYNVSAVPVFFILDEKRIVRKIIKGFGPGITDKEIKNTINLLLTKTNL